MDKAVIYLDQFAFSELFKLEAGIRRPDQPHHAFWSELHGVMRRTLLLQQAIFPASDVHSAETLVSRHHGELRAAMNRLGGDATLEDTRTIEWHQVWTCFAAYREARYPVFDFSVKNVLRCGQNAWLPDMRIVVNADYSVFAEAFRSDVERTADEMADLVHHWRSTRPSFDEVLRNELAAHGTGRLGALAEAFKQYERGLQSSDFMSMFGGASQPVMREFVELRQAFERDGLSSDEAVRVRTHNQNATMAAIWTAAR